MQTMVAPMVGSGSVCSAGVWSQAVDRVFGRNVASVSRKTVSRNFFLKILISDILLIRSAKKT